MTAVTIYHNPKCGTSRNVLALLQDKGLEPVVIQYLKTPLDRAELKALVARLGVPVREVVRWKEAEAVSAAAITPDSPDGELLEAMARTPVLMNRPIVVTQKGARLCRPSETVSELL
ncbi:MAG: arsenate reductase (glutaredoxin) [Alphaproteobacteria bacterium]|nr:arsenate reductase (glutaredoxin) [Alphaproteobacteria bacterium]